ncbi:MAG: DUF3459 domain-containing protein [Armatimonadetes bacterium]|nr:DUF3459 domain-containing protein [Anaerolineae bacterium]
MLDLHSETQRTIDRLAPRLSELLPDPIDYQIFTSRLSRHLPNILRLLIALYGNQYDFFYYLQRIIETTAAAFSARPGDLRALDMQRESNPYWFKSHETMGAVCYVDLFADDFDGVRARIPYFLELGITYLHLMPLFAAPEPHNDGGYAISSFRATAPALGTMDDLRALTADLRANGISLVIDFVFNHTSDEHEWARKAQAGDPFYRGFYHIFPDRTIPNQYERHLREIFPEQAPGNFTHLPQTDEWVWTTFNRFQWDLNYSNPETFNAMLGEMLFLANQGIEVLRLDAVAFIWKQLGTPCENLPQVHLLIQAMNGLAKIAAPALLFKSEAIVHPDDVASYIAWDESPISYNPTFMALIWESLATREVRLLRHSMSHRWDLPAGTAWVNYVRVHDDIGWSFADEDARAVGIAGFDHRQFLNVFYTGRFPGSFATGLPFNYNPQTQDMRICGTAASLAGLEFALSTGSALYINHALRRILLLHSLILSAGGIPLLYLGDEIATLNDYSYTQDSAKTNDSRWVHRPKFDWARADEGRMNPATHQGTVYQGLRHLIALRKRTPALGDGQTLFFDTQNKHVLAYIRSRKVLVLANFSEVPQIITRSVVASYWQIPPALTDLIMGSSVNFERTLTLEAYQFMWLSAGA